MKEESKNHDRFLKGNVAVDYGTCSLQPGVVLGLILFILRLNYIGGILLVKKLLVDNQKFKFY